MKMDFNNYVEKRLGSIPKVIERFNKDRWSKRSVKICIDFYPLEIDENGIFFVPIGTKDSPDGITVAGDSFGIFFNNNQVIDTCHILEIKEYIKEKVSTLKKGIDDQYKIVGFNIDINDFLNWKNDKNK